MYIHREWRIEGEREGHRQKRDGLILILILEGEADVIAYHY